MVKGLKVFLLPVTEMNDASAAYRLGKSLQCQPETYHFHFCPENTTEAISIFILDGNLSWAFQFEHCNKPALWI